MKILNEAFFDFDQYDIPTLDKAEVSKHEDDKLAIVIGKEDFKEHEVLLAKILSAINFDLKKNVRLIQINPKATIKLDSSTLEEIKDVICFGVSPKQISFHGSFKANEFYATESYAIMLAHPLNKLAQDNARKKALWGALQKRYLSS